MAETRRSSKLTAGERWTAALLGWAPWLAFLLVSLPVPLYFLARYFTATEEMGVYMLLALTSWAVGSLAGLFVAALVILYRKRWEKNLRERLAADGITAGELAWFMPELTKAERRTLLGMERQSPLLADAYRETLAARVTAARVRANARREAVAVEQRLRNASRLPGPNRGTLEADLREDRARLGRVAREADEHHAEMEARLQMIEAVAGRGASAAETERALLRLGTVREHLPLGLAAAQDEYAAREQAETELRAQDRAEKNRGLPGV